ncbi:3'-5' exonuclease [Candidatus Vidania fulgoroideorum]
MHNYLIIDLETTGLKPEEGDRIIEIAYIYLKKNKIKEIYNTLINCKKKISKKSFLTHKISYKMLKNKPKFSDIYHKLINKIKKSYLVAHNAKFDLKFLKNEFNLINLKIKMKAIDTLKIFKKIFPGKKNTLGKISERLKIKKKYKLHRALNDVFILYKIFEHIKYKQKKVARIS